MLRHIVLVVLAILVYAILAEVGRLFVQTPEYDLLFMLLKVCVGFFILWHILEGISHFAHPEAYRTEER